MKIELEYVEVRVKDIGQSWVSFLNPTYRLLRHKGHTVELYTRQHRYFGGVHAIMIDPATGTLTGAADPRRDGQAIGA